MAKRRPMKLAVAANVLELAYGKEVFENTKLYAVAESDEEDEMLRRAAQRVLAARSGSVDIAHRTRHNWRITMVCTDADSPDYGRIMSCQSMASVDRFLGLRTGTTYGQLRKTNAAYMCGWKVERREVRA